MFRLLNIHHQAFLKMFRKNYSVGAQLGSQCYMCIMETNSKNQVKIQKQFCTKTEWCWSASQVDVVVVFRWTRGIVLVTVIVRVYFGCTCVFGWCCLPLRTITPTEHAGSTKICSNDHRPHLSARLSLDGFSWNFISWAFTKICPENLNFVKNGRKYMAL
jgi:hypothetical protein